MSSGRRRLGEDDNAVGLGMEWVIDIAGSGMARGVHHHGLKRTIMLRAQDRRRGLGDKASVVGGLTGSG
jgi:hypothetical protein